MERFEKYLNNGNSEEKRICLFWLTSFGIQSVVNLRPSDYLMSLAVRHIKGEITLNRVHDEINGYYQHHKHSSHNSDHQHHTQEHRDDSPYFILFHRAPPSVTLDKTTNLRRFQKNTPIGAHSYESILSHFFSNFNLFINLCPTRTRILLRCRSF